MKKRRWAALVLCLLLLLQTAAPAAKAKEDVYFLAAGSSVLPLSDSTMPFWDNGYLYIPGSIFTGSLRQYFGITYSYNPSTNMAVLYNVMGDRSLIFRINAGYTTDREGEISYPGCILRNGIPYVPAFLVAKYFNFTYSVTEVEHGYLVWLRQPDFGLSEKAFANAAIYSMEGRYAAYLKEKAAATETPVTEPEQGVEIDGRAVYLCLEAEESASAMLDALSAYKAQAAFFCTPEFLKQQGGLLRRMTATGQSIGILADAADPERTVAEQLEAGNRALGRATCGATRLVMIRGGKEDDLRAAEAAGYRCVEPSLDRSAYELKTVSNAKSLLQKISASRGDVSVWLGGTAGSAGLRAFLNAIEEADGRCLALTETS